MIRAHESRSVVYVAGPYTAPDAEGRQANIQAAVSFGQEARALGFIAQVPHVAILPTEDYELALAECFELLYRCDALVLMPTWRESPGAQRERDFAESLGIPIFEGLEQLREVARATA